MTTPATICRRATKPRNGNLAVVALSPSNKIFASGTPVAVRMRLCISSTRGGPPPDRYKPWRESRREGISCSGLKCCVGLSEDSAIHGDAGHTEMRNRVSSADTYSLTMMSRGSSTTRQAGMGLPATVANQ